METVLISWIPPKYLNDSRVQRPYFENLSTADELRTKPADMIHSSKGAGFMFALGKEQKYQSITKHALVLLGITELPLPLFLPLDNLFPITCITFSG